MWIFALGTFPLAPCFSPPVGPAGYYDAQPFGTNAHLGQDWNGVGGGDTDLGDAVHAIGDGRVVFAEDVGGGRGNVVRVAHRLPDGRDVESLYAHLDRIDVAAGEDVRRGDVVGTIGTAHGRYRAHLHLELRADVGMPLGVGYGDPTGYLDPDAFFEKGCG